MRLVIVDDDLMIASINREFALKIPGVDVVATFHDGHKALDFLQENPVDLLLLDIALTFDYSGLDLLTDLRRRGKMTDVIIISGRSEVENVEKAFHLGIVDYLIKPFTYERFQEAMQKFLVQRSSLQAKEKFTQEDVDKLLAKPTPQDSGESSYNVLRKGLQQQTLDKILEFMGKNSGRYLTSEQIATDTGFSKMTVRRYMNYLIELKKIASRTNYATGGRPSIEYIFTGR